MIGNALPVDSFDWKISWDFFAQLSSSHLTSSVTEPPPGSSRRQAAGGCGAAGAPPRRDAAPVDSAIITGWIWSEMVGFLRETHGKKCRTYILGIKQPMGTHRKPMGTLKMVGF